MSDSNRVGLYYYTETNWGEIPGQDGVAGSAPKFTQLRYTGESLAFRKSSVTSQTIRDDRMVDQAAKVGFSADGDVNFEFAFGSFDDFIAAAVGGATGDAVDLTAQTCTLDKDTKTLTCAAGAFTTTNLIKPGQWVKVSGWADAENNGLFQVTAVTATTLVFGGISTFKSVPVAETDIAIKGQLLRNGTTETSFAIEKKFADLTNTFIAFSGLRVNTLRLDITAMEVIRSSMSFIGKKGVAGSATVGDGSPTDATANPLLTGSSNVGTIYHGGTAWDNPIRALSIEINNNLRAKQVVGSEAAAGIGYGMLDVRGSVEAYFEDLALYNELVNHTESSLSFSMTDTLGNVLVCTLPKILFTEGNPVAGGGNQDVMLPLNWQAIRDSTTDCMIQFDFIAAA